MSEISSRIFSVISGVCVSIWDTFTMAAFYILLGLFISGLIRMFIDQERIARHLGMRNFKSVLWAALFGVPLPLCSCGVIPTAISLRKSGASKGATLAFLISTPETGVDSIALTYALLNPVMAVYRPLAAFMTAMVAGILQNIFGEKEDQPVIVEKKKCVLCVEKEEQRERNHKHSFKEKVMMGLRYSYIDLLGDISLWLIVGISLAGIISYFVPHHAIEHYLGQGLGSMAVMLLIGIPLYICASASTPIAAALIAKGMSPGVALVFLLAGPATNTTGIVAVARFLGKRAVVIYLTAIAVCAVSFGLLLNYFYAVTGIDVKTTLGKAGEVLPGSVKTIAAVMLIMLMMYSVFIARVKTCKKEDNPSCHI